MKAGGTAVNYSPLDAERVLEHKVEDSQTDFLFTLDLKALYPQMARLLGKTRLKKLIVGEIAEMSGAPDMRARPDLTKTDQLAHVPSDDRHITFQQLLDNDGQLSSLPHPRPQRDHCSPAIYRRHDRAAERRDADARKFVRGDEPICGIDANRTAGAWKKAKSACWRCCRPSTFMR